MPPDITPAGKGGELTIGRHQTSVIQQSHARRQREKKTLENPKGGATFVREQILMGEFRLLCRLVV